MPNIHKPCRVMPGICGGVRSLPISIRLRVPVKAADAMPIFTCLLALIFSASSWFALRHFGRSGLWKATVIEAALVMALLWIIDWAQAPESPLIVSVLMIAVGICGIAATVDALAHRRPIISILSASVAGVIGTYAGILLAYLVLVYTT
jgi:hypothetical protein